MTFKPGKSGNPAGKPKGLGTAEFLLKLKKLEPLAIKTLEEEMSLNRKHKLDAAKWILERVHGKAVQPIGGENPGDPIKFEFIVPPQGLFKNDKSG